MKHKDTDFKLILVDPNNQLCNEWQLHFEEMKNVQIINGYFEELNEFDCMVSAANSFGLMDGGVDLAIIQCFGFELMDRVQEYIIKEYRGEQPIGTSFIIETKNDKHPFLAHTPTMRVPLPISKTDYVYNAMWAMLLAVWKHNLNEKKKIKSIACPGLGTATGRMDYAEASRQMYIAYYNFLNPTESISWPYASYRQKAIGRGGDINR